MKYADEPTPLWRAAKTGSVLERSLSAARGRGPTGDQLRDLERNVLSAVGAAAVVSIGAAPAQAAVASPGAAATGGVSAAKLAVVLLVTATVAGTTAVLFWPSGRSVTPPPSSPARLERSAAPAAVAASPAAPVSAPLRSSAPGAAPGAAPAGVRAHPSDHPASRATPRALARADFAAAATAGPPADVAELQLLSRARRALATDPALALALAVEHERRFSDGSMDQEREVIAVDALVALGRLGEARDRGERLAREHAGSPYVARIQQILSRGAPAD